MRGSWKKINFDDSHPYSCETSIFTLSAPHEEVQCRQTKLHPGFTMVKLVQSSHVSHLFEIPTLFYPNSLNDVLQNFLIEQWTKSIFIFLHFLTKILFAFSYKNSKYDTCVKRLSEGATACMFHLPLHAFVAAIMKLKARAVIIFS